MESYQSTENHSVGLKNLSNSERGLWAEAVVNHFLISKKWEIISERKKYKFGEIDLVVRRSNCVALIEVKYLHNAWMSFERIQQKQIERLQKNYLYLSNGEFRNYKMQLVAGFVCSSKKIKWTPLI
jgi:Holliday junction resolvase-like predicted endonuclease